ncbi:MAG TPA: nucleotidyltransferase family protein [Pyrinomonadaceae bacterium]
MANALIDTGIIILAAGESRRLGPPKQLLVIEGETLIRRIARRAAASTAAEVLVVLGHGADAIEPELAGLDKVGTLRNPDWHCGIGSSIRRAVEALARREAVLISVCDQPHLTTEIFDRLIARLRHSTTGIVASSYSNILGVPAIFARKHFAALMELSDAAGAKSLLRANDIDRIHFPDGAVDIDTVEDLVYLEQDL